MLGSNKYLFFPEFLGFELATFQTGKSALCRFGHRVWLPPMSWLPKYTFVTSWRTKCPGKGLVALSSIIIDSPFLMCRVSCHKAIWLCGVSSILSQGYVWLCDISSSLLQRYVSLWCIEKLTRQSFQMSRAPASQCWEIGESKPHEFESQPSRFEPWLSQTNDLKIDTCRFLAWRSALLG